MLFLALLSACLSYTMTRGGWPERAGAYIMFAGSFLTLAVNSPLAFRYTSVEIGILIIDILALSGFLFLALKTDRFWPLWITALQIIVVLAHIAKLADPEMLRRGYGIVIAAWSYPQLLLIALGTRAHHRKRLYMRLAQS